MNTKKLMGVALFALLSACSEQPKHIPATQMHMDPQMTAQEIRTVTQVESDENEAAQREVAAPLKTGKRLYDWLAAINDTRAVGQKISFTDPRTTIAYPIDHPSVYNPTTINSDYQTAMHAAPAEMVAVLNGNGPVPTTTQGLSDASFIANGLAISRTYDTATRWVLVSPYREGYKLRQAVDIRGYYGLQHTPDLENKLNHLDQQSNAEELSRWLIGECLNKPAEHFSRKGCEKAFALAKRKNKVLAFHKKYVRGSAETYNRYFALAPDLERDDVVWTASHPEVAVIPFLRPAVDIFTKFLAENVEDEFKNPNWQLKIQFTDSAKNDVSKLEFQPGVMDHVEHSLIVIDQNAPLSEYLTQWAIRHEFGHILGFTDCYAEFYDEDLQAMVNYQLDTTNLMCSRQGHFKQIHYDTLKAKYYKR